MLAYSWNSHFLHNILAYLGTTAKNTTNTSNKYILVKSKVREATSLIIVMKTPYGRCEMPLDKQWVKTMLGPRLLMRSTFFDRLSPGMCKWRHTYFLRSHVVSTWVTSSNFKPQVLLGNALVSSFDQTLNCLGSSPDIWAHFSKYFFRFPATCHLICFFLVLSLTIVS